MTILLRCLPLVAIVYLMSHLRLVPALPVGEDTFDPSGSIKSSRMRQSLSPVFTPNRNIIKRKVIRPTDLASPADLMRPDIFQFYTFDKSGEVVTKQMTKNEIQSLIAAGGGHLPPMAVEIHEPQKVGDVSSGGTRVADVVQNVQNVLKGELSKPAPMISTIPKIPGHANSEWSSILPSILSGDMETIPLSPEAAPPPYTQPEERIPVYVGHPEYDEITEKPMIQVPVITVEDKLPIQNIPATVTTNHDIHDADTGTNGPVFQILNTISADMLKNNSNSVGLNDQMTDASESIDQTNVNLQIVDTRNDSKIAVSTTQKPIDKTTTEGVKDIVSIVSETHSTSIKVPGHNEMKIENQSTLHTKKPSSSTTERIVLQDLVEPDKSGTSTSKPIDIDDKFEKIHPIKPVLLDNVLKKPESSSSTTSEPEMTTVKTSEVITTSVRDEPVTEAVSTITEQNITENSLTAALTSTIESTSVEDTSDEITEVTTEVTQHDSTTPESISITPLILITSNDASTETSSPISKEAIKLEDPITEIIPESTPETTERTNDVTVQQTSATSIAPESFTLSSIAQPEAAKLPTELEDSLSSMISQISEAIIEQSLPSMNDEPVINSDDSSSTATISQERFSTVQPIITSPSLSSSSSTQEPSSTPKSTTSNIITMASFLKTNVTSDDRNSLKDSKIKPSVSTPETETPIVRIDIMSPAPTTEISPKVNATVKPEYSDESPVVRIQLTDPVTTVNHIIESISPESYSVAPEIESLTLPTRGSINANNVSSSLIAGFSNNDKPSPDSIKITDDAITVDAVMKNNAEVNVKPEEKTPEMTTPEWPTMDYDKTMELMLQQINFDELPMFQGHKKASIVKKNSTKIESSTAQPDTSPIKLNNEAPNTDKNCTTTLTEVSPLPSAKPETKDDKKGMITETEINNSQDIPAVKTELETEMPLISTLVPSKIQLDDLPIVHQKFNKPGVKPAKINITESYKKEEPTDLKIPPISSVITSGYEDDPYKKLGETVEPRIPTTEIPQTTSNKTLKIKDQKKDSSMELMEKLPLIPINQIPLQPNKKISPLTTTSPAPVIKKHEQIHPIESDNWTLIPQKSPPALKLGVHTKRPAEESITPPPQPESTTSQQQQTDQIPLTHSKTDDALDSSVKALEPDISYFSNLCNDLAFSFWTATNEGLSTTRSLAVSPFGMTSMLAMVFLGARGPTSEKMNNLLKLDDVASFNPHLIFQNVTDSVGLARKQGIANAAFVRELFADRVKVRKLLPFYKEQAQQFYDGVVAEVNFATISDLVRRRTNLMVRKQTGGRIKDFVRTNSVPLRSPLAALSANVFQTDCNSKDASSDGRDGELYFAVSPAIRQRKLVPVPSTVWRAGILAGYEPNLDATAIALGGPDKLVSTIFVIPGQQGFTAHGDNLELLEERLIRGATHDGAWNKLLKVIIPRPGLELQVPKFSHRSVINATAALKRMGLEELFDKHADLKGINGVAADLHLTDVLQMNLFSTCGDENIQSGRHHVEVYPASPQRNTRASPELLRAYKPRFSEPLSSSLVREDVDKPRLKLDRPFLYFVRHNPTGLILHMGRFNPRLLP